MINNFKIADAHCHIYPEKIAERAVAGTDAFYNTTAACRGVVDELLQIGKATGIDLFVVQSVATTPKQVTSINEFIASSVKDLKNLVGLGTLHPDSEDLEGDINKIISLGLHGVKLHPDIQRFPLDSKKCMPIYEICQHKKLPLLVHTGDYRYDFSNPNRVEPVLKSFPDLVFVGAHLGGWSIWKDAPKQLAKYNNFYVDCSSTFPFTSPEISAAALNAYGAERVLFGSDYPMWHPQKELETFMNITFDEKSRQKILYDNAARVFNF